MIIRSAGLTQTDGVTWEIPLAAVTVAGGVVTVITDLRTFIKNLGGGGRVLINRTLLIATGTIDWTSIPSIFKELEIHIHAQSNAATVSFDSAKITFNGDSGANYNRMENQTDESETEIIDWLISQTFLSMGEFPALSNTTGWGEAVFRIPAYTKAGQKNIFGDYMGWNTNGYFISGSSAGVWLSVAAINRITIIGEWGTPNNHFKIGSEFSLWGIL